MTQAEQFQEVLDRVDIDYNRTEDSWPDPDKEDFFDSIEFSLPSDPDELSIIFVFRASDGSFELYDIFYQSTNKLRLALEELTDEDFVDGLFWDVENSRKDVKEYIAKNMD